MGEPSTERVNLETNATLGDLRCTAHERFLFQKISLCPCPNFRNIFVIPIKYLSYLSSHKLDFLANVAQQLGVCYLPISGPADNVIWTGILTGEKKGQDFWRL